MISPDLFAKEYYCPSLPIKAKIGSKVDNDWVVIIQGEHNNFFGKLYQKYFGQVYYITKWKTIGYGLINQAQPNRGSVIECCTFIRQENIILCTQKYISRKNCLLGDKSDFICIP